jgi:threonine/homoserine/homoserine lactone efflux protein
MVRNVKLIFFFSSFFPPEITESTELKAVMFSKSQLTVMVENRWLVSLCIQYHATFSIKSIIEIASCRAVVSSRKYVYSLTTGGNVGIL